MSHALDGSGFRRLTDTPGYDAEATLSPDGKTIVFTSVRDGDLEIYTMAPDGSSVKRLTHEPGYDGGPFFSPDGKRIVYRRDAHPDAASLARYQELLAQHLYRPGRARDLGDGRGRRQQAPGDEARRGVVRALLPPRRQAHHLLEQPPEPARPRLRPLHDRRRRHRPRARSPASPPSTASRCSRPTASSSCSRRTAAARSPGETNLFVVDWVE